MSGRIVISTVIAVCGIWLAGCGREGPDGAGPGLPEKVVIGYQAIPNGEIIAKDKGWVEEALSVPVVWRQFDSGADVNLAMAGGSIDIGLGGSCSSAVGIARDMGYEVVWLHDVIGDNEALVVRDGIGVESVADLAGRKVAVPQGSTTHYHLMVALSLHGVAPGDLTILDMPPMEMHAAWENGDIDAGFVWEPTLTKMLKSGGAVLVSSRQLGEEGYLTCDLCLVRKEFGQRYPDLVSKYLQAQMRGIELYQTDPEAGAQSVALQFGISPEAAAHQLSRLILLDSPLQASPKYIGSDQPGAIAQVLKDTADFMVTQGSIRSAPPLRVFEAAVNPSYLEKARAR